MKRIVTIQDVSCVGRCSCTVALPIISVMGAECAVLPTAVLSTHTEFQDYTFRDLTGDIPGIVEHWKKEKFQFDCIYTGYLGSIRQLKMVTDFIDDFRTGSNSVIIDPVLGDYGKLYPGFTEEFASAMGQLCSKADVIVPNLTEAAFLLNEPCRLSGYDENWIRGLLKRLSGLGVRNAVLTGISLKPDQLGVMGYDAETDQYYSYFHPRQNASFNGTGDIFASTLAGAYVQGRSLLESLTIAADFTSECVAVTLENPNHVFYGVEFERVLPKLVKRLGL